MDVAILFALILLNGAFAMSEIALVAARKGRLQPLAEAGDAGAPPRCACTRSRRSFCRRCRSASPRSAS